MAAVTGAVVAASATAYSANRQKKAASEASRQQRISGDAAIDAQQFAQEQLRNDLSPYSQFGQGLIPQAQNLFGQNAYDTVRSDPVLQSIQDDAERRIMASQAARGRLGSGDTPAMLQDAFTRSSLGYLGQQRSDLLSALALGQSSAAQQGAAGLQTGQNIGNLLTQIGNVQASGTIGAANAESSGLQNLSSIGGGLLGYYQNRQQQPDPRLKPQW